MHKQKNSLSYAVTYETKEFEAIQSVHAPTRARAHSIDSHNLHSNSEVTSLCPKGPKTQVSVFYLMQASNQVNV